MKKKSLWTLVAAILMFVPAMFIFTACDKHEHTYSEEWSKSATQHWHACTGKDCAKISDVADHTFGEWVESVAATCSTKGVMKATCSVCGYEKTKEVEETATKHAWEHKYFWNEDGTECYEQDICSRNPEHKGTVVNATMSHETTKVPTCTETGEITYTATFENTAYTTQTKVKTLAVNPENHVAGGALTYSWSNDHSTCTAKLVCGANAEHVIATETKAASSSITTPATCMATGIRTYTVTFDDTEHFTKQTETDVVAIDANAHQEGTVSYVWNSNKTQCTATMVCSRNSEHIVRTETVNSTNAVTTAATCTAKGTKTYTATFTKQGFEQQTTTEDIPTIAHTYSTQGTAHTDTHKYSYKCENCEATNDYDLYTYTYTPDTTSSEGGTSTVTLNIIWKNNSYEIVDCSTASMEIFDSANGVYKITASDKSEPMLVVVNAEDYTFVNFRAETLGETAVTYMLRSGSGGNVAYLKTYTKNGKSYADQYSADSEEIAESDWQYGSTYAVEVDTENKRYTILGMTYAIGEGNVLTMPIEGERVYVCEVAAEGSTMRYDFRNNNRCYIVMVNGLNETVQGSVTYEKVTGRDDILKLNMSEVSGNDQYFMIYDEGLVCGLSETDDSSYTGVKNSATYTYTDAEGGKEYYFAGDGTEGSNKGCIYVNYNGKLYVTTLSLNWSKTTDSESSEVTVTTTVGTKTLTFTVGKDGKTLTLKANA